MTTHEDQKSPDFFDDPHFDPIGAAIGPERLDTHRSGRSLAANEKRKAGFYISNDILNRFNRKFHEMKLEGVPVENKSALLEAALSFALSDMEQGKESRLLKMIISGEIHRKQG
jgi:hypothetical protein